jgi:hypothetical protein
MCLVIRLKKLSQAYVRYSPEMQQTHEKLNLELQSVRTWNSSSFNVSLKPRLIVLAVLTIYASVWPLVAPLINSHGAE